MRLIATDLSYLEMDIRKTVESLLSHLKIGHSLTLFTNSSLCDFVPRLFLESQFN